MPDTIVQHGKSFDENIDILFDEIVLAHQWDRPSLLLAVHKSRIGQEKAETELERRLLERGLTVSRVVFNDQRSDIAQLIHAAQAPKEAVYFISNIDWGGGEDGREAYRGLNMHRELFVDEAIKAVFWLTVNEAANLPRFAPDFWAFRHRVVEFIGQRAAGKVHLPAGIMAWETKGLADPFESAEAGIAGREELLRRLPQTMESLSARVELRANLAQLHWDLGDLDAAGRELQSGLELVADHPLPELKASLLNGAGIVAYERGEYPAALERFTEGLRYRSSSRILLINSSAALCMLGRIHDALSTGKKALRANPTEPDTWRRLAYIHNAAGQPDEAIACLAKAVELAPRAPEHHLSLAVLYAAIDRPGDARIQVARVGELRENESGTLGEVVGEAAIGNTAKAQELLTQGISAGRIRKHEIRRDLNLGLLFEPTDLEAVLA